MEEKDLIYEVKDNIGCFTINREKHRNSISPQTTSLFLEYLDKAEKDPDVRAICVTGAGDKAFCSGADLAADMTGKGDDVDPIQRYANLLKRISGFSKPTVAKINGYCLAGGLEFMRIALGTLADARTDIDELYAWQFDGPFLRDFTGRRPAGARRDAGAIESMR